MARLDLTIMPANLQFATAGTFKIIQNVRVLFTTREGTLPLAREYGINLDALDNPMPEARAALEEEMLKKLKRYEPRARILEFKYKNLPIEGRLGMTVVLEVDDGAAA